MSEKKKTGKKVEAAPHVQVSPEKLEAAKAELSKMIEGVQGGEKLLELVELGCKKGKLSSGEMMEVLESITLETEQLDKVYDVLENLGVDTAGDDFVPELDDDVLPSTDELEELPEEACAAVCFCGSHKDAPAYYEKLSKYIEENHLEIAGFSKEITMVDYGITNDMSQFVTEIQIPVRKK